MKGGNGLSETVYELIAYGARYWFAFLGVVIVWRSYSWLRKDRRYRKKRLRQLPDAGMVGEMVVLSGGEQLPVGTVIPVPREGTFGSSRKCDVCLPCPGVAPHHGDFTFKNKKGLTMNPAFRQSIEVDGEETSHGRKVLVMHHGSRLAVGSALLRMRLFAGLETSKSVRTQPEFEDELMPQATDAAAREMGDEDIARHYIPLNQPTMMEQVGYDWENATHPYRRTPQEWQETGRYVFTREQLYMEGEYNPQHDMPVTYGEPTDGGYEGYEGGHEDMYYYPPQAYEAEVYYEAPPQPSRKPIFKRRRRGDHHHGEKE